MYSYINTRRNWENSKFIYLFIYLTLPININTQKIHIWTIAGNTLQLTPITAALAYKIRHHKHIKLITTRYFTGQITGFVTGQTY